MSTPTIPMMDRPLSMMEVGPNGNNLAARAQARHPIDEMQRATSAPGKFQDLAFVRHVYGSGLAMRLATEQKIAAQEMMSTAPGIRSAGLYGDIVTGNDTKFTFRDYLSLPEYRPDVKKQNLHVALERQLGM